MSGSVDLNCQLARRRNDVEILTSASAVGSPVVSEESEI